MRPVTSDTPRTLFGNVFRTFQFRKWKEELAASDVTEHEGFWAISALFDTLTTCLDRMGERLDCQNSNWMVRKTAFGPLRMTPAVYEKIGESGKDPSNSCNIERRPRGKILME
ncbi:hypothetical protein NDU88_003958 [Pleurodeles waltl]|uniref:Uncharacterized protein n=1 Tax=Pleurodeles waltl TaxID=8319 RepID=A0AAV7LTD4_PLEWA|nr:hypothetical protein NDU88_003958 [Pleurodeles waltl]